MNLEPLAWNVLGAIVVGIAGCLATLVFVATYVACRAMLKTHGVL